MNRKKLILIVLGIIVVIGLALVLWTEEEPPAMSIAYEGITFDDTGNVLFGMTSLVTNTTYFQIWEQQPTNGQWQISPGFQFVSSSVNGQRREWHSHPVPNTTNVWRLAVRYYRLPAFSTTTRLRSWLMTIAKRNQWMTVFRWLGEVKIYTIHGPEMLGNKPVEKK